MPMGAFIYILYRERHILLYVVFIHLSNLLPCLDIYTYAHIYKERENKRERKRLDKWIDTQYSYKIYV